MSMKARGHTPGPRGRREVAGATLIELLTVMMVLSVLAGIALPRLRGAILKAEAADVLGDMNVVKVAIITFQADHNAWPSDQGRGRIPPELVEYLPEGFSFDKGDYVLDYDNWSGRRGAPFNVAVTFITERPELGMAVIDLVGTNIWGDGQTKYTWLIDG